MVQRNGSCHCAAVTFAADIDFESALRCNCSICAMRGAVMVHAPLERFEILSGASSLATYTFNTGSARHHFCRECGIYTHHRTRSTPDLVAVNAACVDSVRIYSDFPDVRVLDGQAHPLDSGEWRDAGRLLFVAEPKPSLPLER